MDKTTKPKASPLSLLMDIVFILWCSYRLYQGTSGRGWNIFFCVVILLAFLSLSAKLAARGVGGSNTKSAAKNLNEMRKGLYAGAHEYENVDDSALTGLDEDYYARMTSTLEQLGFRRVGQRINLTVARVTPWARSVSRSFLDSTGTVAAFVYNIRLRGWQRMFQLIRVLPSDFRTVDLETELSDGQFVTTSNAMSAALTSDFTGVHRQFYPKNLPIPELVNLHRLHIAAIVGGAQPVMFTNFEELVASQARLQLLKSAHRSSPDYDPAAEIARVAGRPLRPDEQALADEIESLRRSEEKG